MGLGGGTGDGGWRHFAGGDAVVDFDPGGEVGGVGGFEGEGGEVEAGGAGGGVVAGEAVLLEEGIGSREGRGGGRVGGRRGQEGKGDCDAGQKHLASIVNRGGETVILPGGGIPEGLGVRADMAGGECGAVSFK